MAIKVLVDIPKHYEFKPRLMKRAIKNVAAELEAGHGIRSVTGQTMAIAVDWFQQHNKGFRITAHPSAGYYIEHWDEA